MHRHGGRVKISHVGYSCKSKKIQFLWLSQKRSGILAFRLCRFMEIRGSTERLQNVQRFPFPPEGANFFLGSVWRSTGNLLLIVQGRHLWRLVEGRWLHSCITFKKSLLMLYREKRGPKFDTKKLAFSIHQFGRNFASGRQGASLKPTPNTSSVNSRKLYFNDAELAETTS